MWTQGKCFLSKTSWMTPLLPYHSWVDSEPSLWGNNRVLQVLWLLWYVRNGPDFGVLQVLGVPELWAGTQSGLSTVIAVRCPCLACQGWTSSFWTVWWLESLSSCCYSPVWWGLPQLLLSWSLHTQSIKQWLFFRNLWMRTEISSCSGSWVFVMWRQRLWLAWSCAHRPNLAWLMGVLYGGPGLYKWVRRSNLLNNYKGYFPCWWKVKISSGLGWCCPQICVYWDFHLGLRHLHWIFKKLFHNTDFVP